MSWGSSSRGLTVISKISRIFGLIDGFDQLDYYKRLLLDLGKPDTKDALVRAIFIDAQTRLRKPTNLKALTSSIDQLDWFSAREEGLGTLYEGLLEKNAEDKKSGAASANARRICGALEKKQLGGWDDEPGR